MKKTLIWGSGTYTRLILSEAERYGAIDPAAIVLDTEYITDTMFQGLPVIAFDEVERFYSPKEYEMLVLCGYHIMRHRKQLFERALSKYPLTNYISPAAYTDSSLNYGCNNVIFAGAHLGFDGKMGSDNIIREQVYLGHQFVLSDHNIISPSSTIGGRTRIGSLNYFGLNVTSRDGLCYGDENIIGMASVVTKDVGSYCKLYGCPAKVMSTHEETGAII